MDDIYKNIEESEVDLGVLQHSRLLQRAPSCLLQHSWIRLWCNPNKERKILIIFDDMIADMLCNKKFNLIVTELFIRGRKLNISLVFITESYFAVPKNIRLNSTHYFLIKIRSKRERHQILTLSTLWVFRKNVLQNYILFLVIDATFAS